MHTTSLAHARKVVVASVAAGVVSLPLALSSASSAEAATTRNGCTVTPLAPARVGSSNVIRFPVRVTCIPNRIVQIDQLRYEDDVSPDADDFLGSATYLRTFAVTGTVVLSSFRLLPNTEVGNEEVFHWVRFRVASINGVTASTSFERSVTRSFAN